MMQWTIVALLVATLAFASTASAEPRAYEVGRERGGIVITVAVPYSLGTHMHTVTAISGELYIDRDALAVTRGRLVVPITSIRSDSPKRDCHLREALGLDYVRSRFPEEHVCDGDRLPTSGPDSVAFPDIRFDVSRGAALDDLRLLEEGKEVRAFVEGTWTVHGITRPARIEVRLSKDASGPEAIRIHGQHVFSLRDYAVVVKSARVLFATISVRDEVTASLDLVVKPVATARPP